MKEPGEVLFDRHIANSIERGWKPVEGTDLSWRNLSTNTKAMYAGKEKAAAYRKKLRDRKSGNHAISSGSHAVPIPVKPEGCPWCGKSEWRVLVNQPSLHALDVPACPICHRLVTEPEPIAERIRPQNFVVDKANKVG